MKHDPTEVKLGLQHIANDVPKRIADSRGRHFRESALDALAYIRQLEGDLRRAGFTEYNDPKETEE